MTSAKLVAGAFGECFEVVVDGVCEAEATVDAVVDEPAGGGASSKFLGALFKGMGSGFEGVADRIGDIVIFGVDVVGVHDERGEATEVVFIHAEFKRGGLDGSVFCGVEPGDVPEVSDVGLIRINTSFDAVVLILVDKRSFDFFWNFDPAELRVHQDWWCLCRNRLLFRLAVADVELIVGVVMDEHGAATEVECESINFAGFFGFGVENIDFVTCARIVLAIDWFEFDNGLWAVLVHVDDFELLAVLETDCAFVVVAVRAVLFDWLQVQVVREIPLVAVDVVRELEAVVGPGGAVQIDACLWAARAGVVNGSVEIAVNEPGFAPHFHGGSKPVFVGERVDI